MGNFDFVKTTIPSVHEDCARAESYLLSDPRSACVYSRRAIEVLVGHLYEVLRLAYPYQRDLSAMINDAGFKRVAGTGITAKLNLIRKVGNRAVHDDSTKPIPPSAARQVLGELFHVMVWAAFHHSPDPTAAPAGSQFDPALAAKAAPLSRADVARLAVKFRQQDEAHAKALAEREAQHAAEIDELTAQIAAAQAATAAAGIRDTHAYNEAETRRTFLDLVLLPEAGWARSDAAHPADAYSVEHEVTGMPTASGKGYIDYVLWGADGLPLAVIEAKRSASSVDIGQQQAQLYADRLEQLTGRRPVIYFTNGHELRLWDDAGGYPPRTVLGLHTSDELELLIQRRRTAKPLADIPINTAVAGRPYQQRAIRAVDAAFTSKQRQALLVMATGAGKTRTVVALVDQLMQAGWVKRVLFLADRTALVTQAANAFKAHLPSAPTVNLVSERSGEGRVYVSTYPTMLNLINDVDGERGRRFGPGFFDLVVVDEAHRSVYAKYGAIFEWFDALLLGLTATPKDEVDHNTYRLFHLEDGVPTDAYSLDEAIADGYLVPPRGVSTGTSLLRRGVRYDELTDDEREQWDELDWGDETPDEVTAAEINQRLYNAATVDAVLAKLMSDGHKVDAGDRLGKTIIFARNQAHADFIQERFNDGWPEYAGEFARVITHASYDAQHLIDTFNRPESAPHIAISVDMLDTGIDVPEIVNLVFFKAVHSKSKFWQMIGRGTRLRPDLFGPGEDKQDFFVFDFCGNLEYFSQDLPGAEGSTQKSITQRLFDARLRLVTALDEHDAELRADTITQLHAAVAGMNTDNVLVRPHLPWVDRYADREAWNELTTQQASELSEHVAGLPTAVTDPDVDAKRFDLVVLRRQLAQLEGDAQTAERIRAQVQEIAEALLTKTTIPSVREQAELLERVAGDEWWRDVTLAMLETMRRRLRGLVRLIEKTSRKPVFTDFEDEIHESTEIDLPAITPGMDFARFRAKATAYLRAREDEMVLQRLRRNRQLTPDDLSELESMLIEAGADEHAIERANIEAGGLGLFIRSLVGLDRAAAMEAFTALLDEHTYSAEQIDFVKLIITELTERGVVEPGRLYESPYTDRATQGPDFYFADIEVDGIVSTLQNIKRTAVPTEVA